MAKIELAVVGDNCIDWFVPPLDECFVGGNAVNVGVQLAMLGHSVSYFGAVGDDRAGNAVKQCLTAINVDVSNMSTMHGQKTASTMIEVSDDGDRSFTFEDFGACANYRVSPGELQKLQRMRHVHIGWLKDGGELKRSLGGRGVTVSQDLGVNNEPSSLAPDDLDIAFVSAEPQAAETTIQKLLSGGAKIVVVTMGAAGSILGTGQGRLAASATTITPEDTTGAGDAYFAGFLDAYVEAASLSDCMQRGMQQAAKACMHRGGFPQQPLRGLFDP